MRVESLDVQMKATSTFVCLPSGWVTLPLSPQNCTRSDLRMSEIQNFPGGACPQTPLEETDNFLPDQTKLLPMGLLHPSQSEQGYKWTCYNPFPPGKLKFPPPQERPRTLDLLFRTNIDKSWAGPGNEPYSDLSLITADWQSGADWPHT